MTLSRLISDHYIFIYLVFITEDRGVNVKFSSTFEPALKPFPYSGFHSSVGSTWVFSRALLQLHVFVWNYSVF